MIDICTCQFLLVIFSIYNCVYLVTIARKIVLTISVCFFVVFIAFVLQDLRCSTSVLFSFLALTKRLMKNKRMEPVFYKMNSRQSGWPTKTWNFLTMNYFVFGIKSNLFGCTYSDCPLYLSFVLQNLRHSSLVLFSFLALAKRLTKINVVDPSFRKKKILRSVS